MPAHYQFYANSMLETIESIQKTIKSSDFQKTDVVPPEVKKGAYALVFAARSAANAVKGKKKSLKVPGDANEVEGIQQALLKSAAFDGFLKGYSDEEIQQMMTKGHGGDAEEAFRKYVLEMDKLPTDVSERYMPTAAERIEQQQMKLRDLDPKSDKAIEVYAEIFRTRRAVDAVRKNGSSLESRVNGSKLAAVEDLAKNKVFQDFIHQYGGTLRSEAQAGHAGAAEDMFKDHLLKQDHIPAGAPQVYMPTAETRLDILKTRIQSGGTKEEQFRRYTEIMATREAVNAIRGDKTSLAPQISSAELDKAYKKWSECETFQTFLKEKSTEAYTAATTGHGGKLQDEFRDYVLHLDHIPADIPDGYQPQADKRLEVLKDRYKTADFNGKSYEDKLAMAAEVMATREVVQAERGNRKSLEKPVDPQKLNEAVSRWTNCKAFQNFVKEQPAQVREGGSSGHGGLLGDRFKEYVLSSDLLEEDIPVSFLPTAASRLEVLQKKIRDNQNPTLEQKQQLYAEIMATRSSVKAVRGKPANLNQFVDAAKLDAEREKLNKSAAFQSFLKDETLSADVREAALEGHGGALEDKFKEYVENLEKLPDDLSERYMPTAYDRIESLQKKIKSEGFSEKENAADVYIELMAAREAVNAKRGKADSLKVTIESAQLKDAREKWANCEAFRAFVSSPDSGAKEAAVSGHGGALVDQFKKYIKNMEVIPENVPEEVLPTALERNEALKAKLKTMSPLFATKDEYVSLYAQMLASRSSVGAERGKKETLEKRINPKNVKRIANELMNSVAFKSFLDQNEDAARHLAAEGHGGALEEGFKHYVNTMIRVPQDVPAEYMPTAADRIEGLQEQIKGDKFKDAKLDTKVTLYAELLGARKAAGAVRKNVDSLKHSLPAADTKEAADKLIRCSAFREFVENHPDAVRKAALSGHGGALEDAFKDYVKNLDKIPADVPKEFMPTALERTEILQKKIKSSNFQAKNMHEQNLIYKELVATRAAVNSIRGDKKTLNCTIDPQKLGEIRGQIYSKGTADTFFDEANRKVLYDAATSGHGGALDEKLKEDALRQAVAEGVLPPTPERFRPTVAQLRKGLQENLISEQKVAKSPIFDVEKETAMKRVACAMYLTKLEKSAKDKNEPLPALNPAEMKKNVETLTNAKAFQMMFDGSAAARHTVSLVAKNQMAEVFQILDNNKTILDQQRQQQRQQELQNERNQPVQHQELELQA